MKWFKRGGSLLILSTLFIVYQETSIFNSSNSAKSAITSNQNISKVFSPKAAAASSNNSDKTKTNSFSVNGPVSSKAVENVISFENSIAPQRSTGENFKSGNTPTIESVTGKTANSTIAPGFTSSSIGELTKTSDKPVAILPNKTHFTSRGLTGFHLNNISLSSLTSGIDVKIPSNNHGGQIANTVGSVNKTNVAVADNLSKPISSAVIGNTFSNDREVSVKQINWLQEMAAIKLTPRAGSKFNLQFYFSPTVSFRRLADNQNVSHSSILGSPSVSRDLNINRYVDHNPAIGAELGSNILFSVTRNFILKTGLQVNYSRYNIKAFKAPFEKASIALYNNGRASDTISSYTSIRNYSGYASDDLQNQYLQVSVPIGAELKLIGNKRLQLNVAGTIQPTFLLFSDTYLLSTNYINYVKEPSLVRKWNVHSSFETFISYKTGGLRWQLGPQFRYQLLSSFNDRYPIKEYLFEYGVKIGVSKTIR